MAKSIDELIADYEELANEYEHEMAALEAKIRVAGGSERECGKKFKYKSELAAIKVHYHYTETFFQQLSQLKKQIK